MSVFEIPLVNPIRFIQPGIRFDSLPASQLANDFQDPKCYLQKWQSDDLTRLQILSDFVFTIQVIDLVTGLPVLDLVPEEKDTIIVGQTFKVYEVPIAFSTLDEAVYYLQVDYTDDEANEVTIISQPFEVADKWDTTLLFEYRNFDNNFSVVFDTGITFRVRVEGVIANFTPESDDVIYNDQQRNATLLDSIPFRSWTLYVGNAPGIDPYMGDLINRVMACDQVRIDGDYYEKKVGAAWEVARAEEYYWIGMNVEIMPVENRFLQRIKTNSGTGTDPGDIIIVQKTDNYSDIAGSLTVSGKFKSKTLLEKICIVRTGTPFNMKVGTTDGGSEIGEFQITELITTVLVNYLFGAPATVYLTGLGTVTFLSLIYKQLDEKPVAPSPGSGPGIIPIGFSCVYCPSSPEELDINFNLSTGLGNEGTPWQGWAVRDGRNGTTDRGGLFSLGYKAEVYEIGSTGGEAEVELTGEQNGPHSHTNEFVRTKRGAGKDQNQALGTTDADPYGESPVEVEGGESGGGAPHNNMPPYLVEFWVVKIAE